ncbi:MAG: hypothetical protein O6913_12320 [Chloroflexi bacterium]|nr:hypothetical protein [Chloroflexota bacterium]MCZ6706772.1 hypothetical protein [Chloroflexota bacterium]
MYLIPDEVVIAAMNERIPAQQPVFLDLPRRRSQPLARRITQAAIRLRHALFSDTPRRPARDVSHRRYGPLTPGIEADVVGPPAFPRSRMSF